MSHSPPACFFTEHSAEQGANAVRNRNRAGRGRISVISQVLSANLHLIDSLILSSLLETHDVGDNDENQGEEPCADHGQRSSAAVIGEPVYLHLLHPEVREKRSRRSSIQQRDGQRNLSAKPLAFAGLD